MANKLSYKGYTGQATWDEEVKLFTGRVDGITDVVTFESPTEVGLEKEFQDSVDSYLDFCVELDKTPQLASLDAE